MKVLLRTTVMLAAIAVAWADSALAKPWWLRGAASNEDDFLPPDSAFRVGSHLEGSVLRIRWVIADGYYLYRNKISIAPESPDLWLGSLSLPPGIAKTDPYLGAQEIYTQQVEGTAELRRSDYGAHPLQIKVTYQGCAEAGLCYPAITKVLFPAAASSEGRELQGLPMLSPWEGGLLLCGGTAFLAAGLVLRKGRRRLPSPPP